ncbi:hypothetical protein ASD67_17375 [Sphingopyxis sp. Root1497]|uniref:alpha/beta fold hydrolase n=1 Tax=Sphingopyxis sp. Root1497 TaxID=1736474 RepID=UPI0006F9679D|nr:alpha/beta hydrolase [Sphingopyxis sp. Root1497]KQZ61049.1 hypothetical protein ASD67_17375 [Sphingopyxis sp. Root1497]
MPETSDNSLPTVVCLHSLFLSPVMFDDLRADIGADANVITPTFPGQAERLGEANETVSIENCVDDVLKTLDAAGVESFSLVAQSMGADVAVRIAARHPHRVDRMVLLGASARAEPAEQREAFAASTAEVARNGFGPELVEFVLGVLFAKTTLDNPAKAAMLDDVRRHLGGIGPNFVHAATGVVERESAVSLLPDIKAATLVISGTEDLVRPPAWSDELFEGIPDCQLWRLKGVGHSPALEARELVNPKIIDFLGLKAGANRTVGSPAKKGYK